MHLHAYACICVHLHACARACMHMHAYACIPWVASIYMHWHTSAWGRRSQGFSWCLWSMARGPQLGGRGRRWVHATQGRCRRIVAFQSAIAKRPCVGGTRPRAYACIRVRLHAYAYAYMCMHTRAYVFACTSMRQHAAAGSCMHPHA